MALFDQLNNELQIVKLPRRIVSLVPSITELLYDVQLGDLIVGRTKFCIHPEEILSVAKIGGTKNPNISKIKALKPDLVIANKEENNLEDIEAIVKFCPVYVSCIKDIDDLVHLIIDLKTIFPSAATAEILIKLQQINQPNPNKKTPINTCYLIWQDPIMTIGGDTFINYMLTHHGFKNIFLDQNRYPTPSIESIKALYPEVIMLSSEPYPFAIKHINEYKNIFPECKVILVDGEAFSWYGSRIIKTYDYIKNIYDTLI